MPARISRRAVLGTSACMLALDCLRTPSVTASAFHEPELFVFRPHGAAALVLAMVIPVLHTVPSSGFDVHIHAGVEDWAINRVRPLQSGVITERTGSRVFVGEVLACGATAGLRCTAVVVQTPPDLVRRGDTLGVWAEIHATTGSRRRFGNPFIARLLGQDGTLSQIHNAASPPDDRALLTGLVTERIETIAAANGVANPAVHAGRLAARLLPDVINYRSDLPVGFSFAGQNGRHPGDDTAAVVETVLTGAVAEKVASTRVQLTDIFPYFPQPIGVA